jgi:hypothetical protein
MAIRAEATKAPSSEDLFAQLAAPFDLAEIKWRVTHTTRDGSRGAVIAFADPRAYTDRLNQIFTPTGWTREYEVATISSLTRSKKDKVIQTGKVLVTCSLTVHDLGRHTGSGEEWADEENAMTGAEAQAFKRACSCFGLGRYFYSLAEMWVPLNEYRQPLSFPTLPNWAVLGSGSSTGQATANGGSVPGTGRGPIDQNLTTKIESFRRILGDFIFKEILKREGHAHAANAIPNALVEARVVERMERASRGIQKMQTLAEQIGDARLNILLDELRIKSTAAIPDLDMLKRLVDALEQVRDRQAA